MKPNLTPTELPKYSENIFHWNTRVNLVLANNKVCTKKRCSKYLKLEEIQWFNNASDLLRFPDIFMCPLFCCSFLFDSTQNLAGRCSVHVSTQYRCFSYILQHSSLLFNSKRKKNQRIQAFEKSSKSSFVTNSFDYKRSKQFKFQNASILDC